MSRRIRIVIRHEPDPRIAAGLKVLAGLIFVLLLALWLDGRQP